MRNLVSIATVLALFASTEQARAEQVLLRIDNVQSDEEGWAVTRTLARVPDVKVAERVTKDKPTAIVAYDPAKADLGDLARAVATTKTARPDKFSATIVLAYRRLDANARADEAFLPGIIEPAFAKLQGVVAKDCKLDVKAKEIRIKLDGRGGAKLADFNAAFPGLALELRSD